MDFSGITKYYYENDAKRLHKEVDKILRRFCNIPDKDDFYSLANEVFLDVLERYDENYDFNGFLYSCLENKIKTYFTRLNREKRKADRMSISIDTPLGDEDEGTIGDMIASNIDVCEEAIGGKDDENKIEKYLNRLSKIQRKIVELLAAGYKSTDIQDILHINSKSYKDNIKAIQSYENICVLL